MLTKEELIRLASTKTAAVTAASIVSAAAGAAAGIAYAIKKLDKQYSELAAKEIADAKEYYKKLNKADQYSTPERAAEELMIFDEAVKGLQPELLDDAVKAHDLYSGGNLIDQIKDVIIPEDKIYDENTTGVRHQNIFRIPVPPAASEESYNWENELEWRQQHQNYPFVISAEEFLENEPEYRQVSFTYYVGDRTLADEQDEIVDLVDSVVGQGNLQRFGHWSEDPRAVYVRNDQLHTDFHVLLSDGEYRVDVLGLDKAIPRPPRPARERFRNPSGSQR